MEDKILKNAIGAPHAYPWKRANLDITDGDLNQMLKNFNLDSVDKRRIAGFRISTTIYKHVSTCSLAEELIECTVNSLKKYSYISKELIEDVVKRKRLFNENEIGIFKGFTKNTLTIEQKNKNASNITMWLVDLVTLFMATKGTGMKALEIANEIEEIMKSNFEGLQITRYKIDDARRRQGMSKEDHINLISNNFRESNKIYGDLLTNFIKEENGGAKKAEQTLEDSLFEILNDIDDSFDMNLQEIKIEVKSKGQTKSKGEKEEEEVVTKEEKKKDKSQEDKDNNEVFVNLKALAKSLGYEVVSKKFDCEEEDKEIEMLKELASLKKGAVLSELYNAYRNIDSISKENLEAIMSNFFTALRVQGFEADDEKLVGDKVTVDTKNILNEFVFSNSTSAKGIVDGTIEYLSWNYKGKRVTPMVVKPNK